MEELSWCDHCGKDGLSKGVMFKTGRTDAEYDLPIVVFFCNLVCAAKAGYGSLSVLYSQSEESNSDHRPINP